MLATIDSRNSSVAEAYRSVRTSLQFAGHDGNMKTILVTSPSAGEGKTSTIANLGVVLAQAELRVVIVSCDLRRPRLGQFYDRDEIPRLYISLFRKVVVGRCSPESGGRRQSLFFRVRRCPSQSSRATGIRRRSDRSSPNCAKRLTSFLSTARHCYP